VASVILIGGGVTSGIKVHRLGDDKVEEIFASPIPWIRRDEGEKNQDGTPYLMPYWSPLFIDDVIGKVKSVLRPGDVAAGFLWGADGALLDQDGKLVGEPQFYGGVREEYFLRVKEQVQETKLFRYSAGAPVAGYQFYAHLQRLKELHPEWLAQAVVAVPLMDYWSFRLSGRRGHEQGTAQSEGTRSGTKYRKIYQPIVGNDLANIVSPWSPYPENKLISMTNGAYLLPIRHDSLWARLVGLLYGEFVHWTGGHSGISAFYPSKWNWAIHEAGLSIEGSRECRCVNQNTHCFGPIFERVQTLSGMGYPELGEAAAPFFENAPLLDPRFAVKWLSDPEKGARLLIEEHGSPAKATAGILVTAARLAAESLRSTCRVLKLEYPTKLVVVGGWGRNPWYCQLLEQYCQLEVAVVPNPAKATHLGAAASAYALVMGISFQEAYETLASWWV